ncbi:hypothetical protein ANN_11350 [Periplaneta americana]|uniref:Uncharacterized protein n=1 Tax=Periplaneta americana TaxID=6978 RepID=A0ABQ8T4S1_PERAM|nr:hypothetical protein ANN_11350 [Periplaneta americana]
MEGLCESGNEPPGSLKARVELIVTVTFQWSKRACVEETGGSDCGPDARGRGGHSESLLLKMCPGGLHRQLGAQCSCISPDTPSGHRDLP